MAPLKSTDPDAPPQTPEHFLGDCWHELRAAQTATRRDDLAEIAGQVTAMYRRASIVMGREDDPVAEALEAGPFFDGRSLIVAHAHLAAWRRLRQGHVHWPLPGIIDLDPLLREWSKWVRYEVVVWILRRPRLIRLATTVVARSLAQRVATIEAERDLWDGLRAEYPLPPNPQRDLFRAT